MPETSSPWSQTGSVSLRVAFANSEFRGLAVAYLQSTVGDQFAAVAVTMLVYDRTGSPGWTAAAYALTMLPSLIAGPALSWVADRYPPAKRDDHMWVDAGRDPRG